MRKNSLILSLIVCFIIAGFLIITSRNKEEGEIMGIPKKYLHDPGWVRSTIYYPFKRRKNITASGLKFGSKISDTLRIIAVSRDLRKKYPFHTKVLLVGAGKDDGIYKVEDLMNSRFKNRIDILVGGEHELIMYDSVKVYKISEKFFVNPD
jgi:3D (Asp-Asp-Asp) domain-containing protein